jgi:hypothetical protein
MFGVRECVAITWDMAGNVAGLRIGGGAGRRTVVSRWASSHEDTEKPLTEKLALAYDALQAQRCGMVALGGHAEGCVLTEMKIPPAFSAQETNSFLSYELQRRVPMPLDEMIWGWRKIHGDAGAQTESVLRVFAVPVKSWNVLISEINSSGVRADVIVHPFLAADPFMRGSDIALPAVEPDFYFAAQDEDGLRKMVRYQEGASPVSRTAETVRNLFAEDGLDPHVYGTAVILSEYVMGRQFAESRHTVPQLPPELAPRRFDFLKISALILSTAALVMMVTLAARDISDAGGRMSRINDGKRSALIELDRLKREKAAAKTADAAIEKIMGVECKSVNVLNLLRFLGKALPEHMWVTNINTQPEKIDVTIKTNKDDESLMTKLKGSKTFGVGNYRKRRNADGSVDIYLELMSGDKTGE